MKIILPIYPKYFELIVKGEKIYEFRKFMPKKDIDTILFYATAPVKSIVGQATIRNIITGTIDEVWKQTKNYAGISHEEYSWYYNDKNMAIAYELKDVIIYDNPKILKEFGINAPVMNFAYIK